MKKSVLFLALLVLVTVFAAAQTGIRPILSAQWDFYLNDAERGDLTGRFLEKNIFDINGVSIFPFSPGFALESKAQVQVTAWTPPSPEGMMTLEELEATGNIGDDWWEVTISAAPIFVVAPFYFIVRPAIAFGNGVETTEAGTGRISPSIDGTVDLNLETAKVIANATVRGTWHRAQDLWFVIPSGGATLAFSPKFKLGSRVFWSYTQDYGRGTTATNWAVVANTELPIDETKNLVIGGSVSWSPGRSNLSGSAFFGITFPATTNIQMKYQLEPIIRTTGGLGFSNVLVMDARL